MKFFDLYGYILLSLQFYIFVKFFSANAIMPLSFIADLCNFHELLAY